MRSTLFHLPARLEIGGASLPLFGPGVLLAAWAVCGAALLLWTARREGFSGAARALWLPLAAAGGTILWILPALDDGGGVPIRGYGVMLLAAAAAGIWLSVVRGRSYGFDADTIISLGMEIFLWGIVGARLFYLLEYRGQFFGGGRTLAESLAAAVNLAAGGLVVFGSIPTGALAAWWFARRRGLSLVRLADCIAPGLLLGLAIGRIGCFLNGCCYGGPCGLPWAVRFPPESPPWLDQAAHGTLPAAAADGTPPWSAPVHPAQLYAAIDAALLATLAVLFTPLARRDGQVFALVLTLHPISRLLLEAIRVDEQPALGTPFSISQLVSFVLIALGGALWWWTFRQPPGGGAGPLWAIGGSPPPGGGPAGGPGRRPPPPPDSLTIRCRENGPLVVEMPSDPRFAGLRLRVTDPAGRELPLPGGDRPVALCRCGHSRSRPFCDGSHKTTGVRDRDPA
jgi:phosphatidylglycerol:prolipoprotein diacylglycerol transferase